MEHKGNNLAAQAAKVALGSEYSETYEIKSELDPSLCGSFTISLPTAKEHLEIGVIQHRLRKGVPLNELDSVTASAAVMLSTLSVVVRKAPVWWYRTVGEGRNAEVVPAPEDIHDMDLLWDLYGRYTALRATFPRKSADAGDSQPAA